MERIFGETVTANDTALRSSIQTLDVLTDFVEAQNDASFNTLIFLSSKFAVTREPEQSADASPHEEQVVSIECFIRIGELLDACPNVNTIRLLWLPRTIHSVGFKRAEQLAFEAIRTADLRGVEEPHSIKDQKKKTKDTAKKTWAEL
jgi:hypothetical protein